MSHAVCYCLGLIEASSYRKSNLTCGMITQVHNLFLEAGYDVRMNYHSFITLHNYSTRRRLRSRCIRPKTLNFADSGTHRVNILVSLSTPHTCLFPAIDIHLLSHDSQNMEIQALSPETIQDTAITPPDSIPAAQIDSTFSTCIGNPHSQLPLLPLNPVILTITLQISYPPR